MSRWINRFFALMTFGPVLIWLGAIVAVMVLGGIYDCKIDEAGAYPRDFHGADIGKTAAMLGFLAAWGPVLLGPIVLVSAGAWGLLALIGYLRRRARLYDP